jgi:adenine-specific DNA-methyltransferase
MKYMGSKRRMLRDGLGDLICDQAQYALRIVDLFCGAGSVAWYAAQNTTVPVVAVDLQAYAVVMARAVIARNSSLDPDQLKRKWLSKAKRARSRSRLFRTATVLQEDNKDIDKLVQEARALCQKEPSRVGPVWGAYGGYYFNPTQALTFDYMLKHLPTEEPERSVCLAATISAASTCAAAPGHTAQPFRPTRTAEPYIREAWGRDPFVYCWKALKEICPQHAKVSGEVFIADAIEFAAGLKSSDLVIVDPPYSGVQYSRFYHVLETIARGYCSPVSGAGRYPLMSERPQSNFSKKSQSQLALERLLNALSTAGAKVIFTFPAGECSNGLSGQIVINTARTWFDVEERLIGGQFSTLGGNNNHRASRKPSSELLLLLWPKVQRNS